MDIIIRVATGAVTEVVKYLVSPLTNHLSYLVHHKRNAIDLRNQIAMLGEKKTDVQRSVDDARTRGDVIKVVVEGWLTRVDQMQSKEMALNNILEDSKGCLQGGCSVRYKVGKDAKQMIDKVKELLNEGRTFDVVSIPAPLPPSLETMQTPDFQVYDSTKLAMDQIMEALKHEDVDMVGVYGLGGVGKTTLMKEVAKILKKEELFDQVVMVTVSQDPVWTKIQGEIGENLGLQLTPESLSVRGRLLLERLKKEKRILIILDDLWKPLNLLEQVGIPYRNNCKVVLTTRQLEVCNQMKTQFNVEVKVISEGDSWTLFKWAAGDRIEDDNMLRPVAEQIVKECGGLPLAIITIGRALRAKDQSEWEDAASQLKKSSSSPPDIEGVHEKVFCSIKLSYDFLASDVTKFCFLLCCMFPEDSLISEDDLLPYVVGEGVFGNSNGITLKEARNRLHTQMQRLKRSCLLLGDSGRKEGCVRMHDIIRDVSLWIASRKDGHDFVVESGRSLTSWPDGETLRNCKRLSFMGSEITKLPNELDCSQLIALSLRDNTDLMEIPDGFFQGMMSLKTLDMERTDITSIPTSLSCLTNLRVLRITRSLPLQPLDVSLLGNLKKLEILHLHSSNLEKLPKEIGELTNLKSLNLSKNRNLNIAPNTLSRLSLLEELDLEHSFEKWQMEGSEEQEEDVPSKACLSEIASLSALTTLKIGVLNVNCFCANIPYRWENLTRFSICLGGYRPKEDYVSGHCTTSVFIYGSSIPPLNDWVRMHLFERAEGLHVRKCNPGFNDVLSLGVRGLNSLKILYVEECYAMEYLLDTVVDVEKDHEVVPQIAFTNLEALYLLSLPNFKAICGTGSLRLPSLGCFNNLRFLVVFECDSLRSIIPSDLLAKLPNLEQLKVGNCRGATEVFNSKGVGLGPGQGTMTKLKRLHLQSVPSLMTIWEGIVSPLSLLELKEIYVEELRLRFIFSLAMAQRFQQLKQLDIWKCPEMEQIFSIEDGDELQLNSFSTSNVNSPSSSSSSLLRPTPIFGNLRNLRIHSCDSLKHILPMSLALQSLLLLEELEIHDCSNLEEIIVNNAVDDIEDQEELVMCKTVLFPRLRILELDGLPNLSMVSKGVLHHHDYWPSLETLRVRECPNLKRLPLSLQTITTKLREIVVEEEWFNGLEWADHDHQIDRNKFLHHLQERIKLIPKASFSCVGSNWDFSDSLVG